MCLIRNSERESWFDHYSTKEKQDWLWDCFNSWHVQHYLFIGQQMMIMRLDSAKYANILSCHCYRFTWELGYHCNSCVKMEVYNMSNLKVSKLLEESEGSGDVSDQTLAMTGTTTTKTRTMHRHLMIYLNICWSRDSCSFFRVFHITGK